MPAVRNAPRPAGTWLIAAVVALLSMATLAAAWPGSASKVEYDGSVLAAELLQLKDVPGMVLQRDQPAVRPFLRDPSTYGREVRDQLVMGSWFRAFIAPDFSSGVMVEAVEFRSNRAAKAFLRPKGRPDGQSVALPPGAEARLVRTSESQVIRSTVLYIGRVAVNVEIFTSGPGAYESSGTLLSDVAFAQAARIGERPDAGGQSLSVGRMSVALLASEIAILVFAQLAIGAVTLGRDRSARQRLRQRVMTVRPPPLAYVVDVNAGAVGRLRQHARRAVLRNAVAIGTLLVSSFVLRFDLWQTAIAMVAVLLVWSLVERRLGLRPHRPGAGIPRFRSWTVVPGLALLLAAAGLIALGILCLWMLAVDMALGSPGADEEMAQAFRRFALTVAVTALLLSLVPVALARRIAMRTLANDLRSDPRPTTLLLRAFVDDRVRMRSRGVQEASLLGRLALRRFERFEEVVARALSELGPVAALSEPGVRLPPLGAVREAVTDGWQDRIAGLIDNAPVIVVCLARTSSLAWEIRQIRARRALCRTVFVLPPTDEVERRLRLRAFAQTLGFEEDILDLEEPGRRVLAVVVTDAMEPIVITSAAHDDVSYETAILRARRVLAAPPGGLGESLESVPSDRRRSAPPWNGPVLHPPGAAPRSRRWYRTPWGIASLVLLLPGVYTAATSVARPAPTPHTVIDTETNVQDFARDPASDTLYAILQDGQVLRLDLATASAQPVSDLDLTTADVAVDGGWLVATGAFEDEVVGADLRTGATWRTRLADAPRGVVIVDGVAIVTLAGTSELAQLDVFSGGVLARAPTGAVPWDVALVGDELVVSLAAANELAVVDPLTLVESRRVPASSGPRDLVVTPAGKVWVYSAAQGAVWVRDRSLGNNKIVAETPVFAPATSLTGSTALAVHTSNDPDERIAVFRSRSEKPCIVTGLDEPVALAVDGVGRLLVAYAGHRDLVVIDKCRWDGGAQ